MASHNYHAGDLNAVVPPVFVHDRARHEAGPPRAQHYVVSRLGIFPQGL